MTKITILYVSPSMRKKDILTPLKRPKWPMRPNERLYFKTLSHFQEQQIKIGEIY